MAQVSDDGITASSEYDVRGNVVSQDLSWANSSKRYRYEYMYDDTPSPRMLGLKRGEFTQSISYDALGRVALVNSGQQSMRTRYLSVGEHATDMVSCIEYGLGGRTNGNIRYTYDKVDNIERVIENGRESVRYHYDQLNRLVREDNKTLGMTNVYEYDGGGAAR